jgi:glutamyl-tRNA reductase
VAKLLHDPTVNVKAKAGSLEGDRLAAALQQLFDL